MGVCVSKLLRDKRMKNNSICYLSLFTLCLGEGCSSKHSDYITTPPNVILIMTDDQGWGDFGFNGNKVVNTPVLDSISALSAHLTQFYVSPLSGPTRAGLLTGRDHLNTGALFVTRASENMDNQEQTIAEVFKANNYATGCFGKWHNGAHYPQDPNGQGFDEFVGFCAGHLGNYFNSMLQHNQSPITGDGYITDFLTDKAIEFIEQKDSLKQPFLCYVPYNAPHAPYQVPDEYYDKYSHLQRDSNDTSPAVYAMSENIDTNIGRIFQCLSQLDIIDNTIVVFLTDNGPNNYRYNGVMRGRKGEVYEGGIRVPCLIYWNGRVVPATLPQNSSYIDIMPTILDLCDIESTSIKGKPVDGMSLRSLLDDSCGNTERMELIGELKNRYLFTHRSHSDTQIDPYEGVVFNDTYKLVNLKDGTKELYNKVIDPAEEYDIASGERDIFITLSNEYDEWYERVANSYKVANKRTTYIGLLDTPVELPAHEAQCSGRTCYFTNSHGWAGDWLVDMSPEDSIFWDVNIVKDGEYEISLDYSSVAELPRQIAIRVDDKMVLEPMILPIYTPHSIESPDRVKRVEAYEQVWRRESLGVISLKEGEQCLSIDFSSNTKLLPGDVEIKTIVLKCKN